jgi:hypothetical protein
MRRIALPLVVLAAALMAAAPAQAIQSIQKGDVKVTPNTAGTKAKPQAISMTVKSWFDDIQPDLGREVQFAMVKGDIFFPKEGLHNMKQFPGCAPTVVFQDEKQCPADSKIGSGKARGIGLGLDEAVELTGFNMPGGKGVVVLVVGDSPLIIREVVELNVKTLTGDPNFKYQVSFNIPQNLQSPAPGVLAAVKELEFKIPTKYAKKNGKFVKKKGQRIPYIATTGCATGKWTGKFTAYYTTSYDSSIESDQTIEVSVPCKKPKKK